MNADHKLLGTDLDKIASAVDIGIPSDNAYRAAARAACEINDAITGAQTDVPLYADVELEDGGAWVTCKIFITDAQAQEQGEN